MQGIRNMNWGMGIIGLWVTLAPLLLGYSDITAAVVNGLIVGVAVVVLATASALTADPTSIKTMNWVTAALGLWLVLAPFILGYAAVMMALWNHLSAGLVILALSLQAERELLRVMGHANRV